MDQSLIWWMLATTVAFFVKGLCGFANTLVFNSIMSFNADNVNITPVELLLGYPTNFILAFKGRKNIDLKMCIPLILLVTGGSIPGALFLKNADTSSVKIFFGFVIILIGLEMLVREFQTKKIKQNKLVLTIIGILSGILCGLYGIGALVGAYINRVTDDSDSFKANICFVFFFENTFRIVLYIAWGIITMGILKQALLLMPLMLIGLGLGMFSVRFLPDKLIKRLVIVMLIISGVALILNQ